MKIIVIGAGIVGSSVAYHLTKKEAEVEVIVVDHGHEGQATAAGAGIVCPWFSVPDNPDIYRLAKAGACYYPNLISELKKMGETEIGYKLVGAIKVSADPEELDVMEKLVRVRLSETSEVGEITRLSGEETKRLFPPLREDLQGIHVTGGARVDGQLLKDALLRVAEKQGAKVQHGDARLKVGDGQVAGVHVEGEFIVGDAVVVTAGAWAKESLYTADVNVPVEPQKGQIVHLELPDVDTSEWPVVLPESSHYLLAFDDSRVVAGATRERGSGFDYRVTARGMDEVLREALTVAPGLKDATLKDVRIGFRPVSPDLLPLIGEVPSVPNIVVANGLGSLGLTMGPYVGKLASQLALGESVDMDLEAYSPVRKVEEK
ncbi:D-amino-acid dehydrogenase [Evansella vedderi]|uniref:D-amino-acid dehydrogenase n=1 Tax=Evansella vedderi TaxID=38282 RepID=A0ABU0A0F0_9BACI|nr:FAD-binding oxidoreductase [Evansella vedderi]MDQ0256966.1 D-amino-acid dehydrogenase [Evansella vedderi]